MYHSRVRTAVCAVLVFLMGMLPATSASAAVPASINPTPQHIVDYHSSECMTVYHGVLTDGGQIVQAGCDGYNDPSQHPEQWWVQQKFTVQDDAGNAVVVYRFVNHKSGKCLGIPVVRSPRECKQCSGHAKVSA